MDSKTKRLLNKAITIFIYVLIAVVIVSWVPPLRDSIVGEILFKVTNPVLGPMRAIIPSVGGLDFSVLILIFGLQFVQRRVLR